MERVSYMEGRERDINESAPLSPEYAADDRDVSSFRLACVDRIWRLAAMSRSYDGATAMAAVRLFDRCMGAMNKASVCRANMLLLAVASFDICFKAVEGDVKGPGMLVYYQEGYNSRHAVPRLSYEAFARQLVGAEIEVMKAVSGQPVSPTALDYLRECCPAWTTGRSRTGRRAEAAAAAYTYVLASAERSSKELAAGAAWLALGNGRWLGTAGWPTAELALTCASVSVAERDAMSARMAEAVDALFSVGAASMMYYFYRDVYDEWVAFQQKMRINATQ